MPVIDSDAALACHVPDLRHHMMRPVVIVAKCNIFPIGRPGYTSHEISIGAAVKEAYVACGDLTDTHRVIVAGGSQVLTIGRPTQAVDRAGRWRSRMSRVGFESLPACR